jgi:alpha-1,2-mannosyltransferase
VLATLRTGAPRERIAIAISLALLAVVAGTFLAVMIDDDRAMVDLGVYRTGGLAWLRGVPLYQPGFPADLPGPRLPFTYPPIAAVLFSALTSLPWVLAMIVWTSAGLAFLAYTCLTVARLDPALHDRTPGTVVAVGLAAAAIWPLFEPARETLIFGQINFIVMGLVVADCLLPRTPWPRGLLIGIAASIKLTPAVFILFFLPLRQWRPVVTIVFTFVAMGLLGFVLAPADSREYWFHTLRDPSRVGGLAFAGNQSFRGVFARLPLSDGANSALWLASSAIAAALGWRAVRRARRAGDDAAALFAVAAAGLLASPVSWSHHWVWVIPVAIGVGARLARSPSRARWIAVGAVAAVFAIGPHWLLPREDQRELAWTSWQHLIGDSYVWLATAFLGALAFGPRADRAKQGIALGGG